MYKYNNFISTFDRKTVTYGLCYFEFAFAVSVQILPFTFAEESVNSGDMATVQCAVPKGDFPINFVWMHNGKKIDRLNGMSISKINKRISTLTIDSVSAEHSGNYTCIAKNLAGFSSHSAVLNVNGTILANM